MEDINSVSVTADMSGTASTGVIRDLAPSNRAPELRPQRVL